jgi:hypothetical protein
MKALFRATCAVAAAPAPSATLALSCERRPALKAAVGAQPRSERAFRVTVELFDASGTLLHPSPAGAA